MWALVAPTGALVAPRALSRPPLRGRGLKQASFAALTAKGGESREGRLLQLAAKFLEISKMTNE